MHAFDVLGDPVRRRLLQLLADGERPAGELAEVVRGEFGISQPAVSQHLRVLRENGFASVRPVGARRLYAVEADPLREVDAWLGRLPRASGSHGWRRSTPRSPAASASGACGDHQRRGVRMSDADTIDTSGQIDAVQRR